MSIFGLVFSGLKFKVDIISKVDFLSYIGMVLDKNIPIYDKKTALKV